MRKRSLSNYECCSIWEDRSILKADSFTIQMFSRGLRCCTREGRYRWADMLVCPFGAVQGSQYSWRALVFYSTNGDLGAQDRLPTSSTARRSDVSAVLAQGWRAQEGARTWVRGEGSVRVSKKLASLTSPTPVLPEHKWPSLLRAVAARSKTTSRAAFLRRRASGDSRRLS